MKKGNIAYIFMCLLVCGLLTACGDSAKEKTNAEKKEVQHSPEIQPSVTVDDEKSSVDGQEGAANQPKHTINVSSSDKGAGYPHGIPKDYHRYVCYDGEWVYAVQDILLEKWDLANGCAIVRFRKDGTDMQTLLEFPEKNKDDDSSVFCLNMRNDWMVFLLKQRRKGVDNYYICKMKSDGTHFEKLQEAYANDLWLYEDRIYYSYFTKWGGSDIYSMDMNGKDEKQIVEEKEGLEFEVAGNKIYAFYSNDNTDGTTDDYSLYEMDLKGGKKEKLMDIKDAYGDTFCLWGNSVFFLNGDEQLCRQEVGDTEAVVIMSLEDKESEYCIYDDWIYFIDDDLYRISVDGGDLTAYHKKDMVKKISSHDDWGIFDGQIYFEDCDDNLILIRCDDGKTSKIKRKVKKI